MKGTKIYSIFKMKCPKCHETDMFKNKNPYNFSEIFDMNDPCEKCGQKMELEPGFYYGSMYVSYGVGVAWMVSVWVALSVLVPDFSLALYFPIAIGGAIAFTPVFFRFSRAIWINLFVGYDKDWQKNKELKS